jgi:predicted transposase/invertase (TIGR01784 family)
MIPRYLDPKSDLVFKKIFGQHPELLKSFLNAILPLPQDCVIESLTYLPSESVPEIAALKYSIVDVRCFDNHGRHFIVEMQLQWTTDFIKRMLYNTATTYTRQLLKGEEYDKLSPVYGLAILNESFNKDPEWFHHYRMTNVHDGNKRLEDIQLVLIELPKLKLTSRSEKRLAILWLRFLKEMGEQTVEVDPLFLEVAPIKEAVSLLETASYDQAELMVYDKIWDSISSEKTLFSGKYKEGRAEGRVEGLAEGIAKGKLEGMAEIILNMHYLGISLQEIARISKLELKEVETLIKNLSS